MKRRTDTCAQQYRIRAEYAARKAQSLAELALAEWQRLRRTTDQMIVYDDASPMPKEAWDIAQRH